MSHGQSATAGLSDDRSKFKLIWHGLVKVTTDSDRHGHAGLSDRTVSLQVLPGPRAGPARATGLSHGVSALKWTRRAATCASRDC